MDFTIAISKNRTPFGKNIWLILFTAVFFLTWTGEEDL
jgi:hypothetical protein